jgi:hypothetical protein
VNKFLTYVLIFAAAASFNPLISFIFKPFKQLGVSSQTTGVLGTIAFYLLMLTFCQLLMIINESKAVEYIQTSIDEVPSLDWRPLEQYTFELESLGFDRLMDYKPSNLSRPGLGRLFAHKEERCFAEVNQISGLPTVCVISSVFTDKWALSNLNHQFTGFFGGLMYMRRRKRSLWIAQPDRRPAELLNNHRERRAQIMSDLEIETLPDLSAASYFDREKWEAKQRLHILKTKWIVFGLIEAVIFAIAPKSEWMGDYRRR